MSLMLVVPRKRARSGNPSSPRLRLGLKVSPKLISLVALAVQNAALAIVMHHSRVSVPPQQRYQTATAVLLVEILKGSISLGVAFCSSSSFSSLIAQIASPDCFNLAIPAAIYVLQARFQYTAAANLDPSTFTVSYQAKILTTALFSFLLLRTRLRTSQWIALLGLAVGVAVVQIQSLEARQAINTLGQTMQQAKANGVGDSFFLSSPLLGLHTPFSRRIRQSLQQAQAQMRRSSQAQDDTSAQRPYHAAMNPFLGFLAVGGACLTSGFAGVYFEKLLKGAGRNTHRKSQSALPLTALPSHQQHKIDDDSVDQSGTSSPLPRGESSAPDHRLPSLWIKNVQLSLMSLPPAIIPVLLEAYRHGARAPFAHITHPAAMLTIAMQVLGGLLTALVIKHANNILKGFAVAFSVLLSFAWSALVIRSEGDHGSGIKFNGWFFFGSALTLVSTFLYNRNTALCQSLHDSQHTANRNGVASDRHWRDDDQLKEGPFLSQRDSIHPLDPYPSGKATTSSALRSIVSGQPTLVSSVWSSAREPLQTGNPGCIQSSTLLGPVPRDHTQHARSHSHNDSRQASRGVGRGAAAVPRQMAEAAWATVMSYSQIPLAISSDDAKEEDEDDNAYFRGRSASIPVSASEAGHDSHHHRDSNTGHTGRRRSCVHKARSSTELGPPTMSHLYATDARTSELSASGSAAASTPSMRRPPSSTSPSPSPSA
ncbi:hypothetical protein OC861_001197 [Tilletia horrida]|nr:hypothetical protein OC845_001330 [Tilletia horrida]KAK0569161.1 hypothetical protein OC861_001197 [Tilletia horrida]